MRLSVRPLKLRELDPASELIARSWAADYSRDGYFAHSPELLHRQYEAEEGSVWMGAFWEGGLVGVNASLPRKYMVDGQILTGGVPTYLSVDPGRRRMGIARHLIEAVAETHASRGDSLLLPFFDEGGSGIEAYRKSHPDMEIMWEGKWLVRLLLPEPFWESVGQDVVLRQLIGVGGSKKTGLLSKAMAPLAWDPPDRGPSYRQAGGKDVKALLNVLNGGNGEFRRQWSGTEMRELLDNPWSNVMAGEKDGEVVSAAVYQERTLMSRGPLKVAWFDGVWGPAGQRLDMMRATLRDAKERECAAAMWPAMGTEPGTKLLRAGFFSFPRRFIMGGIGLNGHQPRPVGSYCLDVR